MDKVNIKAGSKLDVVAQINGRELEMKSSFVKSVGGNFQITMPMHNGKSYPLDSGTAVTIIWTMDNGRYTFQGRVDSSVKQGVRTNLLIALSEDANWVERRAHQRIPAELNATITLFNTDPAGNRREEDFPGKTTDISNGGVAVLTSATLAVGEVVSLSISRRGMKKLFLKAEVCWSRPAPKGMGYRYSSGLQFLFSNNEVSAELAHLTASLAAKK